MEELLNDINESINLFKEKRMKNVWKSNTQLKMLMKQESDAEKKYNELSLDGDARVVIDEWISCINKLVYRIIDKQLNIAGLPSRFVIY